ncbi:MAG TPA: biliverdin-producing heme oxygenase [Flavobacteriales bacterium]
MELTPLELVRQHTREAHETLEKKMHVDRIMAGTLEPGQLVQLLQVNAHFLEAVERNALRFAQLVPFVVPRSALAVEDLRNMGAGPLPRTHELDAWDMDQVRGGLYVALGSLLGGSVIASKLKGVPGLPAGQRFYALDQQALAVWRNFLAHLATLQGSQTREGLVHGARRTFQLAAESCDAISSAQHPVP